MVESSLNKCFISLQPGLDFVLQKTSPDPLPFPIGIMVCVITYSWYLCGQVKPGSLGCLLWRSTHSTVLGVDTWKIMGFWKLCMNAASAAGVVWVSETRASSGYLHLMWLSLWSDQMRSTRVAMLPLKSCSRLNRTHRTRISTACSLICCHGWDIFDLYASNWLMGSLGGRGTILRKSYVSLLTALECFKIKDAIPYSAMTLGPHK